MDQRGRLQGCHRAGAERPRNPCHKHRILCRLPHQRSQRQHSGGHRCSPAVISHHPCDSDGVHEFQGQCLCPPVLSGSQAGCRGAYSFGGFEYGEGVPVDVVGRRTGPWDDLPCGVPQRLAYLDHTHGHRRCDKHFGFKGKEEIVCCFSGNFSTHSF